jgi:hypothetical protein
MSCLSAVVSRLEQVGGRLMLDGDRIRYSIPKGSPRAQALLEIVRTEKQALVAYLRARAVTPAMPRGVVLMEWKLKEPPVAIETFAVVTDPDLFARATLQQLRIALAEPKRWVGWSVPQLIDRLAQVGVRVTVDRKPYKENSNFLEK